MAHVNLILIYFFFIASSLHAFSADGINECIVFLNDCAHEFVKNGSYADNYCLDPFGDCMKNNTHLPYDMSEECFIAQGSWLNVDITIKCMVSFFAFTNLVWPATLKATANWINKIANYNEEEHPCLSWLGKKILSVTDTDGDGRVSAQELVSPKSIMAMASLGLPVYQVIAANIAQAKCDYQNSLLERY